MPRRRGRGRMYERTPPAPNPCPWWDQFPNFTPNPDAGFSKRFKALANMMGWSTGERMRRKVEAMEAHLAMDTEGLSQLEVYQNLCVEVGVVPGQSITQCKKALKSIYINLVNLIDTRCNPRIPLLRFDTYEAFRNYTRNGRTVPKKFVKRGGFVDTFLREVYGPDIHLF